MKQRHGYAPSHGHCDARSHVRLPSALRTEVDRVRQRHGYGPVTAVAALTPMAACVLLWGSRSVA
jgi:hypothetical protein